MLLPSGPRGALLAVLIAALLFTGVWVAFDRATGDLAPAAPPPPPTPTPSAAPTVAASATAPTATPTPRPSPTQDTAAAWDPVLEDAGGGLVQVVAISCDDTRRVASGFAVGRRRVVTAAHLLVGNGTIRVRKGGQTRAAQVVGADRNLDLALLEIGKPIGSPLALVEHPVAIGQRVAAAGLDDGPMAVPGTVSGVDVTVVTRRGRLGAVVRTDAAVEARMAGAPLLATTGRVGGVVLAPGHVTSAVGDIGFALPAERVQSRLARWEGNEARSPRPCETATPTPTPTPSPEPTQPTEPTDPPAPSEWIAILESLPTDQFDRDDAVRRARSYRGSLDDGTKVLLSSDWPSLNAGYWVVYTGPHGGRDAARAACGDYGSAAPACYPRELAR